MTNQQLSQLMSFLAYAEMLKSRPALSPEQKMIVAQAREITSRQKPSSFWPQNR